MAETYAPTEVKVSVTLYTISGRIVDRWILQLRYKTISKCYVFGLDTNWRNMDFKNVLLFYIKNIHFNLIVAEMLNNRTFKRLQKIIFLPMK